jgi:dTDP-4-dehydrorhamnose reductase
MALEGVLLFGAAGQLGHELSSRLSVLGPVKTLTRQDIDLCNATALRSLLQAHQPAWIVNASGYTAVDKAEQEPALAQAINATAPSIMAEEAARTGACLVHYSTDYVFNGHATRPYLETDKTDPLSAYGMSKRDGELAVTNSGARHLLFRSSWVVGAHGQNFLKTMLRLAQELDSLRVVADQVGVPTSAAWMADTTVMAMQQGLQGLFHLTPTGQTNWHAYAQYVLQQAQSLGWVLKADPAQVLAIGTADYPLPAVRPAYSLLDSQSLARTLGMALPPWQAGVDSVLRQLRSAC